MKLKVLCAVTVISLGIYAQKADSLRTVDVYSKKPISLDDAPIPIQIIDSTQLYKMKGADLSQILETAAGIQINGSDLNYTEPKSLSIRGSRNKSVVILLDGMPIKDASATDYTLYDLRNLDVSQFEQIEILNQSASVLYGSNATVSVINLKRKKWDDSHVSLHLEGGSFNTQSFGTQFSLHRNNWEFNFMGDAIFSDGFSAAEGEDFDKDGYQKYNIYASVRYNDEKWDSRLFLDSDIFNYEIDQAAYLDGNGKTKQQNENLGFSLSRKWQKNTLILQMNTNNYRRKLDLDNDKRTDYFYIGKYSEIELKDSYKLNSKLSIIGGVQYERQVFNFSGLQYDENFNANFVEVYGNDSIHQSNTSLFAQLDYKFSKMIGLNLGARYNNHSQFGSLFNYSFQPYLQLKQKSTHWKLAFNIGSSFISPTLYQLYGDGSAYLIPSPNLGAEKNLSYSADISMRKDKFSLFGSVFSRKEKDVFIYDTDPASFVSQYKNLESNSAFGYEFGAEASLAKWLKIAANVSYVKNEKEEAQFRIPNWRSNAQLYFNLFKGNSFNLQGQYVGSKTDAFFDNTLFQLVELEDKSYWLWSFYIQQNIEQHFEIYASIQNILDAKYVDIVGYTSMPRNLQIGFRFSF